LTITYFISSGLLRANSHFLPCRKSGASPPSQVGSFHQLHHLLGSHLRKGFNQSGIPAYCQIVINAFRVNLDIIADEVPHLILVEGYLRFSGTFFSPVRIDIEQPVDDLLGKYGLRNDLFLHRPAAPEDSISPQDKSQRGASLTKAGAAGFPDIHDIHLVSSPCFLISSLRAATTFAAPRARQPVPVHTAMQGLFGSLFDMMSFLNSSNSAGEFILGIVFPYSYFFNTSSDLAGAILP
jgi:hypothetical protein